MKRSLCFGFLALALIAAPSADVWDTATDNDNSSGTDNELVHGSSQIHDLGVQPGPTDDEDWYLVGPKRQSSYEVVMDATTGDIGINLNTLQLVDGAGAVIQNASSVTTGLDHSRSLRIVNTSGSLVLNRWVRVAGASCGGACATDDQYQIRMMETTIGVARFNNSGTQVTVVLAQNTAEVPVNATYFFWSAAGALVHSQTVTALAAKGLNTLSTSGVPALAGQSGSITVAHDAPYGALNIKAVALEPSTGFSFDTPGVYRGL